MPGKGVKVRPYQRSTGPVRGHVRHQTWSEHVGSIFAGHQKGSVKKATLAAAGISLGSILFAILHVFMTTAECVIVIAGIGFALFASRSLYLRLRRLGLFRRRRRRAVTFSLKARKHHLLAKARKVGLRNGYRGWRDRVRKNYPIATGVWDGWLAKQEVTIVTGAGKTKSSQTIRTRGARRADLIAKQERERHRQKGTANARVSQRQVFR